MNAYTLTTHIGNVTLTRVTPLSPEIVRFSVTAKLPNGSSRFTEEILALYGNLLLTRTKRKRKQALEAYLKANGIELSVSTGIESISFTGSVRKSHIEALVSLLSELIYEPMIDHEEFSQKKKLALEANREGHDNAKRIAHVAFVNALYPNEPRLHLNTLAEEKRNLLKATPQSLDTLHSALPKSVWYVTLVGDEHAEYAFMRLAQSLSHDAVALSRTPITASPVSGGVYATTVPGKTNIEVQIGNVTAIRNDDPAFVPLDFGIDVLGKVGGFSGRLMSIVREKEGLTYGIYAHTNTHHLGDSFHYAIRTFFMAKDYEKGIASTLRELTQIHAKGITEKELQTFKEILSNDAVLAYESNETRLHLFHTLTVRGYNEFTHHEMLDRMRALTRTEVNKALRTYLDPSSLVISVAGPIGSDGTPLITAKS